MMDTSSLIMNICICLILLSTIVTIHAQNFGDFEEIDEFQSKQNRRSDVSRALGLLKKHSVVGTDAKIVLKNNGKHLLVDPSKRIQVVSHRQLMEAAKMNFDTDVPRSRRNSHKSAKLKSEKSSKRSSKRSSRKRLTDKQTKVLRDMMSNKRRNTNLSPDPILILPQQNIEKLQKSIMDNAASKSPVIVDALMGSHMLQEMTRFITAIVRNKRADSLIQLSDLVTETLDERYGPHWHTVAIATPIPFRSNSVNEVLISPIMESQNQLMSLTHIAIDDHRKSATFYVTYDFGRTLRLFIFK